MLAAGVLPLHDNAPDYYLFQNLKSPLRGTRFLDDDELKAATEAWFEDQIYDYYFKGIDCLKEKWAKCIEVKGVILKNNVETIFQSVSYWTPLVNFK